MTRDTWVFAISIVWFVALTGAATAVVFEIFTQ
jgi:hypothetical protein